MRPDLPITADAERGIPLSAFGLYKPDAEAGTAWQMGSTLQPIPLISFFRCRATFGTAGPCRGY
ncbi:MAG: hypothetical protein RIS70_2581 [Planctomycetota bacterium]